MLTTEQFTDIEQLQKEVEAHDGLEMKLNWDMLRNRSTEGLDMLHYEKEELIAFLGMYPFGSTIEVTGMVKPSERRKGHFTRLFEEAMGAVRRAGFKKILLNAPASSSAAKEFLLRQGARYAFSEHQMQWQPQPLENTTDDFILREAAREDLELRVRLDVEVFNVSLENAVATESRINRDEHTEMLMIDVSDNTIGKIRVKRENGQAWIYGFSILPEHQGKGFGRKVLRRIVKQQSERGHSVHLEVETKNANALRLYESVGFEIVHAQDYYEFDK
ncbi:GNAT family N-acetyltransferase [Planococcus sp. APC 3906]|uniref:GNAT family N-acetyltransferase n=1 Tax=Planococcus sp. APC 3906 TaxID=3035194 RepID=UPI0025B4FCE3|nr:GNAT family N-acetyltransferase [Planococcus sp. APC 3906]MDN3450359.1 GNAT family N-acetyltransferase [Planococcus sp. APC 3906]